MPLSPQAQALYVQFGRRVAAVRNALPGNVTQGDLAARTAGLLSRSAIANIETGRHRVALHQAYALADVLGCSLDQLLPDRDALRSDSKIPLGAGPDDVGAAKMMEMLQQGRRISVLHAKPEK